jgi:hypothetical protein
MTPENELFQTRVAQLALSVAQDHGFALGGSRALIAYGIIARPTEDVDLFSNTDDGVQAAAELVRATLLNAGLAVDVIPETSELGELFYGFEREMVEFEVREADNIVRLQLVRFDRSRSPVVMEVGPVLHIDDVVGSKVAAMATRAEPRDFIDVAALLARYSAEQLVKLGLRSDPALTNEDFADALRRLDRLDDSVFADLYGRTTDEIAEIRARFATWSHL